MTHRLLWIALAACALGACGVSLPDTTAERAPGSAAGVRQDTMVSVSTRADGRHGGTLKSPRQAGPSGYATTGNGINYNGGPIMSAGVNVYLIWYGSWGGNSATAIIPDWASTIGGSPYFNINTTYDDNSGGHVLNAVTYAGATTDAYSRGTALSDADIQTIVSSAINGGSLPLDTNGLYFVLTSSDVNETTGFCTRYCGWHTYGIINGANIKYSFVGNPDRCPSACEAQSANSPNGNPGADGMISVLSHELEETATDPNLNAWYDSSGAENGDKCAWTFGTEYTAPDGARANMHLGGRDFLIQRNWVNAGGGYCDLSYGSVSSSTWGVNSGGYIYRYVGGSQIWQLMPGIMKQVSAGNANNVWAVDSSDLIYRWTGSGWAQVQGGLDNISAAADGTVWGVNSGGYVYRYVGGAAIWQPMPGIMKQVSVGSANNIWAVDSSDQIFQWNGSGWVQIPGGLINVAAGGDGSVWGVNRANYIYHYVGGAQVWENIPGFLKQISVGGFGNVWGVNSADQIYQWTGSTWVQIQGGLDNVSAGN